MGDICFNGKWASDYGITVEKLPSRPMTKRQYTSTAVPGRTGNVLAPESYFSNISQPYEVWIKPRFSETMTDGAANRLAEWLYASDPFDGADADGYLWIEDTYSPTVMRRAIISSVSEIQTAWNKAGRCTITFEEKPQKYSKSGLEWPSTPQQQEYIDNPSKFPAKPLFRVELYYDADAQAYEAGEFYFQNFNHGHAGDLHFVCFDPPTQVETPDPEIGNIYVDSETMEIYRVYSSTGKVNAASECYIEETTTLALPPNFPMLYGGESSWIASTDCDVYVMRRDWTL